MVDLRCGVYVVGYWKLLWGLIVGRFVVVVNSSRLVAGYCGLLGCCCLMVGELVVVVGLRMYNMLELYALFCCTFCKWMMSIYMDVCVVMWKRMRCSDIFV